MCEFDNLDKNWYEAVLSSVGDGVLSIDEGNVVIYANFKACEILDCELDNLIGMHIDSLLTIRNDDFQQYTHFYEWIAVEPHHKGGVPQNSYITSAHGEKKYISVQYSKIEFKNGKAEGGVIILRDISQIVEAQKKVVIEHDNMTNMFEELPIGMLLIDQDLRIVLTNHSFEQLMGVDRSRLVGSIIGDAMNCVWSFKGGCGGNSQCLYCKLRSQLNAYIELKVPFKNFLTEIDFEKNGKVNSCWLNLCFLPSEFDGKTRYLLTVEDFTDRIDHERRLKEAKNLSMTILNSLPVMVYRLDSRMKCDFINETFKSFFKIERIDQFDDVMNRLSSVGASSFNDLLREKLSSRSSFTLEVDVESSDGNVRHMVLMGRAMVDSALRLIGFIGLFLDVHDKKVADILYRKTQNKYSSLFQNIDRSISYFNIIYDQNGAVIDAELIECNQATYQILKTDMILNPGMRLNDISFLSVHQKNLLFGRFDEVLKTGESFHVSEMHLPSINKWIGLSIYSPEQNFVALLITDIDDIKLTQFALLKEKERSEAANHAKSDFLANMSHEIRTPLNGILGMVDLTLMDPLNQEQKDNLHTAKDCVVSLIDIINDILDFSKIEAGKFRLEIAPFSLTQLVEKTLKLHVPHLNDKNLELVLDLSKIVQDQVVGDEKRIKQVLNNLVSNAIKFTEKGSITVELSQKPSADQDWLFDTKIRVIDTGIGIEYHNQHMLFNSFTQIDSSYTRQYGGSGLGLVISKQLIEMMAGTINFTSDPDNGSVFEFTLPLEAIEITSKNVEDEDVDMTHRINKKILLVEDDKVNQIVMKKMIEREGATVVLSENGIEAINQCNLSEFDLIFMDIQMPIMDGIEATRQIRSASQFNRMTPIVALTAFALKGDEEIFKASGMDGYVSKPIDRIQLAKTLNDVLDYSKRISENRLNTDIKDILDRLDMSDQNSKLLTKEIVYELRGKIRQLKVALEQENYVVLEINTHQLKVKFDALKVEELKNMAFKIELELRKERYERVKELLEQLEKIIEGLYESGRGQYA